MRQISTMKPIWIISIKGLAPELETVYLIASHEVTPVSSSRVRELIYFEGDISSYVPQAVVKESGGQAWQTRTNLNHY